MSAERDTIFALSTPPGRGGIAVFRISGPSAGDALAALSGAGLPPPRQACLVELRYPEAGVPIDRGLVLWFPGPASFTGEDLTELHLHGGRAVVAATAGALAELPGLRVAEPGEFTRRAFDNGKLDLAEVEGLADLINAETEAQRRVALDQLGGALSRVVDGWRRRLIEAGARLEAWIDFPEDDLPAGLEQEVALQIAGLRAEMSPYLASDHRGERLRDGLMVAILGAPNVGKSSLLNAIARRDVAIVSDRAGTTRDVIEVHLDLGGYPLTLADTAGLRAVPDEGGDEVEAEGVARARGRAQTADLCLVIFDATLDLAAQKETADLVTSDSLAVFNKVDLAPPPEPIAFETNAVFVVSAKTGTGLEALLDALAVRAEALLGLAGGAPLLTRLRHREALADCVAALVRAEQAALPELRAEDLRLALRALGRITGKVDVEELLDVVFREFCIGK